MAIAHVYYWLVESLFMFPVPGSVAPPPYPAMLWYLPPFHPKQKYLICMLFATFQGHGLPFACYLHATFHLHPFCKSYICPTKYLGTTYVCTTCMLSTYYLFTSIYVLIFHYTTHSVSISTTCMQFYAILLFLLYYTHCMPVCNLHTTHSVPIY